MIEKPKNNSFESFAHLFADDTNFRYYDSRKKTNVSEEIARKRKLENDDKEQDIKLKKQTLIFLLILLIIENVAIFVIVFFQGFENFPFRLGDASFNILTTATIAQIAAMVHTAVRYLFPNKK